MQLEFALFYFKRRLSAGWIAGQKGGQCLLELSGGLRVTYPAAQVLFRWKGELAGKADKGAPAVRADRAVALAQLKARQPSLTAIGPEEMSALHRRLPKGAQTSFARIAQLALPKDAGGWSRARLYCGLLNCAHLFRPAGGGFVARGAAERRKWEARQAEMRARAEWRRKAGHWREGLERGERPRGKGAKEFAGQLASLLMEERQSPHWEALAQPLGFRRAHMDEARAKLRGWLEITGVWPGWPDMWLKWGGVAHRFPPELKSEAAALAKAPPEAPAKAPAKAPAGKQAHGKRRSDFRKHDTYTIDAAGSKDLDDAICILEEDGAGITLALHIAQLPPALAPGHPLFEEAARRASSVYTPRGNFPMFPASLSTGRFSLLRGKEREVASFILRMTEAGGELLKVEEGLIRVKGNMDYGQANALMADAGGSWARLHELCGLLQTARAAAGAQISERLEVVVDASDPARVRLALHDRRGAAQLVVEEMAVLLNREAGRYCRRHGLPAIYRVQPRPRAVGKGGREIRKAAGFTTRGAPHFGLACDRYIQVTSPIRRFADLVMQQQIAGHAVHQRVTYESAGRVRDWARAAEARAAGYAELEARITDYWKRVYLAQQAGTASRGAVFSGTVRSTPENGPAKVWLEQVHLLVDAQLPGGAMVGDTLDFQLKLAHPENHRVLVTPV